MSRGRTSPPPAAQIGWGYFLDVDGTLIEFANTPDAVHVDEALLGLVSRLHQQCGGALALVSGRALLDLEWRLGSLRLPIAGQHGLERRDAAGALHVHGAPTAAIAAIRLRLQAVLERHPALLLEDKGMALAVHYRQAPALAGAVHRLLRRLIEATDEPLQLQTGKRVVEIKPQGFDKGTAIEEYLAEPPFKGRRPVFIGDDATDEHGFAVVNRLRGLSVKVGPGPTEARYRLPDVAAVRAWLSDATKEGKP
ncbi:trehalose-6-phosphate phosphatase [mine drainage metagenome]|uniref:trehalose-phosphatase n=1 Tax=mine drainage metagenome TaxID=410659 RepID=A0A1J5RAB2_9ZZZZ